MVVLFGVQPPKKQTFPGYNIFPLLPYPEANRMKKVSVGYWFGASSCQMNQCVPWCSTTWHRTEPVRPATQEHSKCADQTSFVFARNILIMRCQHAQKNMGPAEHDITTWLAILLLQKDSKNSVWTWNRYHGMRWSHSTIASISHSLKQLQKHKKIKKQEHHLKMWVRWEPTALYIPDRGYRSMESTTPAFVQAWLRADAISAVVMVGGARCSARLTAIQKHSTKVPRLFPSPSLIGSGLVV